MWRLAAWLNPEPCSRQEFDAVVERAGAGEGALMQVVSSEAGKTCWDRYGRSHIRETTAYADGPIGLHHIATTR